MGSIYFQVTSVSIFRKGSWHELRDRFTRNLYGGRLFLDLATSLLLCHINVDNRNANKKPKEEFVEPTNLWTEPSPALLVLRLLRNGPSRCGFLPRPLIPSGSYFCPNAELTSATM